LNAFCAKAMLNNFQFSPDKPTVWRVLKKWKFLKKVLRNVP